MSKMKRNAVFKTLCVLVLVSCILGIIYMEKDQDHQFIIVRYDENTNIKLSDVKERSEVQKRLDVIEETDVRKSLEKIPKGNQNPDIGPVKKTEKWIIVTSISSPTEDIKSLAKLSEWQLLVVGDTKTPEDWHLDGVLFLSVATQKTLGYKILEHLPYSSYCRKNVGYLYAIQHGAKVIYETDDDNHPTDDLKGFITTDKMYGVVPSTNTTVFNPYAYYGQPTTWPRGYPLDRIGDNITIEYNAVHWNTALIQQGAVNGDPDVDAIYRLSRKSNSEPLNLTYDNFMPPLFFPKRTFVPWNSQNTLFHYNAFWGLLLPVSVTSRVTDIWRSYFTQTLLWLIDGHLSYMPPNCYQFRNVHSYMDDAKQEKMLFYRTSDLVSFLSTWNCKSQTLFSCIQTLADDMAQKGFWEIGDVKLTVAWLQDLVAIGYRFPAMPTKQLNESAKFTLALQSDNRWPISLSTNSKHLCISQKISKIRKLYYNTCNKSPASRLANEEQQIKPIPILLLIIFNVPHYETIPYMEALYNGHFVKTIYCGPEKPGETILTEWKISFIQYEQLEGYNPGSFHYECLMKVIKLGIKVKGVLTIADDSLMKPKAVSKFPRDEVWYSPRGFKTKSQLVDIAEHSSDMKSRFDITKFNIASVEHGEIKMCNSSNIHDRCAITITSRPHLNKFKLNIRNVFDELHHLRNSNTLIQSFLSSLSKHLFGKKRVTWGAADVYYLPEKYFEMVTPIVDVFYKHKVFVEIAIPTILHSLGVKYQNLGVAVYNWDYTFSRSRPKTRDKPWLIFPIFLNSSLTFLHPVKLSGILKNDRDMTGLFCTAMNHHHFTHPFENGP